jgi:diacylglycerol kinase (ATP)
MTPFWYIIANPAAGHGKVGRHWPKIERRLQELGFSYTIQFTRSPAHAPRLLEDAILKGHRYFLGIGGDGTNHELINGILSQSHVPSTDIFYALLPMGTGNDWARTHGISTNIRERLNRLRMPEIILQDAGKVHFLTAAGQSASRFFANVAGIAYDGYVVKRLASTKSKSILGSHKISYLMAVTKYLFEYTPESGRIEYDGGGVAEDTFYTINIGICRYSGGGMQFVPHAIPDDGLLALTIARSMPRWEVLLQMPRFYNGTLLQHPKLSGVQTQSVKVTPKDAAQLLWLEADGEFLGRCPAEFSILEKVISVVL